jgi:DNA gyrase subunit A
LTDVTTTPPEPPRYDIKTVSIEEEMKTSYLDYAMSVIVARALPDVRDGLKPVHRRILYAMQESGYTSDKPYKKSARIVGDVMGKYHPHGDQAIYDAMVRMTQDFSMRLPLLDGQGNFGSMDGDKAAAMRYTEIRMGPPAEAMLDDIDKDTVDFSANYDESTYEPKVLPARFPNLLVNGAGGIAVGMATNIPPHNLGEVIDACCAYIDDPAVSIADLMEMVPGPDFPTGGIILGFSGCRAGLQTGRGSVVMRGKVHFEEIRKDRHAIIVTEVPYQVNKASMVEKIAEAVRDKRIEGIADLRDESDRDGVRVVIELKRDAVEDVVLNQLYRFSPLQSTFGVNMLALNGGRPELLDLKRMIHCFVEFREEVIARRTRHLLGKARDRAHVLIGLVIAVANIDEVIKLIRAAPEPAVAREQLMERNWPAADVEPLIKLVNEPGNEVVDGHYRMTEVQARAILDLRLNRLTALGRDEIGNELEGLAKNIAEYLEILASREKLYGILRAELVEMREKFATPRRTEITANELEYEDEDLIQREDMVVTVSHAGYIKRVPLSTYRAQRRGGKGRSAMATREEDFVSRIFVANTHQPMLFFATGGKVYELKVWRLPAGTPQSKGRAMINMLPLEQGESIATIMPLPEDEKQWDQLDVMFATAKGNVRRNKLSDFTNIMANGKIAIRLDEGDRLIGVASCSDEDDVLLAASDGKAIRFPVNDVRVFKGRTSDGVRGMKLAKDDRVISMSILKHNEIDTEERDAYLKYANALRRAEGEDEADEDTASAGDIDPARAGELAAAEEFILSVTENGFGKRTSAYEYRTAGRGGQGIINILTSKRNGSVVAAFPVGDQDEVMMVTNAGQTIRIPIDGIRIAGRNTQGVILFRVEDDEKVVSVARLTDLENGENGNGANGHADAAEDPEEQQGT